MISRILVPLDGSKLAEEMLPLGASLAAGSRGSLILMHAVIPSEYFSLTAAQYVRQEQQRTAAYFDQLAKQVAERQFAVETRILTGEPSGEIVGEARRSHVDLIVMASHGRSGIREWPFGSVAERVLRSTNVPVLVARGDLKASYAVRKILIALDGSEECYEALGPAADLAGSLGASLILAHVGKEYSSLLPMAERLLAQRGCPFEMQLLRGDPAGALIQAVQTRNADLLALTAIGESQGNHIRFGSVAEKILMNCPSPMLVVHTGLTK